jgi:hypothetical protein
VTKSELTKEKKEAMDLIWKEMKKMAHLTIDQNSEGDCPFALMTSILLLFHDDFHKELGDYGNCAPSKKKSYEL